MSGVSEPRDRVADVRRFGFEPVTVDRATGKQGNQTISTDHVLITVGNLASPRLELLRLSRSLSVFCLTNTRVYNTVICSVSHRNSGSGHRILWRKPGYRSGHPCFAWCGSGVRRRVSVLGAAVGVRVARHAEGRLSDAHGRWRRWRPVVGKGAESRPDQEICHRCEPVCSVVPTNAGWSSSVARWAHNPEVAGSNPVPATTSGPGDTSPGPLHCFRSPLQVVSGPDAGRTPS